MDGGQLLTIIGVNVALMYWIRQDSKDFSAKIESWKEEINKEMKDFHGRLCAIEAEKRYTKPTELAKDGE